MDKYKKKKDSYNLVFMGIIICILVHHCYI